MSSDMELPLSFRKKLLELQKKMLAKKMLSHRSEPDPKSIVLKALEDERAKEVLEIAEAQYPEVTRAVIRGLAKLIVRGEIESIDAYTLYNIFLQLGLPLRLPIRIKFVKRGRELSIRDVLKED